MKKSSKKNSRKAKKKPTTSSFSSEVRLQKIIADAGICSRRKAEDAITDGMVKVNGKTVKTLGTKADPASDQITFNGKLVRAETKTYIMLNKPAGFVCTASDPEGRPTVTSIITHIRQRVYPVGRLDFNTTGLLLLTNDGDFAQKVIHPSSSVVKKYSARVRGLVSGDAVVKMKRGMTVEGIKYRFKTVIVERVTGKNSVLHVELLEGKKHHIKNLCKALGHPVVKLARVGIGPLKLTGLRPGEYRHLSPKEIKALLSESRKKKK